MLGGRVPDQRAPQRRLGRQVEGVAGLGVVQPRAGRGQDELMRLTVLLGEDRAQGLVPGHHVAERREQSGPVQLAA